MFTENDWSEEYLSFQDDLQGRARPHLTRGHDVHDEVWRVAEEGKIEIEWDSTVLTPPSASHHTRLIGASQIRRLHMPRHPLAKADECWIDV